MSIQYDDPLLDFDLDFLHQTTNKSGIPEKPSDRDGRQRKSVSLTKKKIIATDSLIRKYYEKKEEVEQLERTLNISKDEYKETCIELNNIVEKCTFKEQEAQALRNSNVQLQERYEHSQNIVGAMQSHANQLQSLVKQNETTIASLTTENKLHKSKVKDYEKKFLALQNENEELMRHICLVRDVVFGKRKLNKYRKEILQKYRKQYESDDNDSLFGDQSSDHETDTENGLPLIGRPKDEILPNERSAKDLFEGKCVSSKDDNEQDSDCSNELASADTGRGSSLAFSDGDKCFNSPDYFVTHSPINPDIASYKSRKKFVNTATSPIPFPETIHVGTSPAKFEYEDIQITLSPLSNHDMEDPIDMAVSPTRLQDVDVTEITEISKIQSIQMNVVHDIISNNMTKANLPQDSVNGCELDSDICIDEETSSISPVIISGTMQLVCSRRNSRDTLCEEESLEINNSNDHHISNTDKEIRSEKECQELTTSNELNVTNIGDVRQIQTEKECQEINNSNNFDKPNTRNSREIQSEKECLELNNSNNLYLSNSGDCEIEMILQRMRLHHTLLTPIPNSPSKSTNVISTSCTATNASQDEGDNVCKHVEKIREENKILNAKLTELALDIVRIKDVLKNNQLLEDDSHSGRSNTRQSFEVQPCAKNIVAPIFNCVSSANKNYVPQNNNINKKTTEINSNVTEEKILQGSRKRPKRPSVDKPDIQCKRMLRSSTLRQSKSEETRSPASNMVSSSEIDSNACNSPEINGGSNNIATSILKETATVNEVLSYNDIEIFASEKDVPSPKTPVDNGKQMKPKDSLFCTVLDKYGKQLTRNYSKKLSDSVIASSKKLLEEEITSIGKLNPNDTKKAMNQLVDTIMNWDNKTFMYSLMAYLKDPQRKVELFNKIYSPPAPPMTKSEQILLYIISQLRGYWSEIVNDTLRNIEYMLFKLNRTPEFDTIESTSHFYAVLCRYFDMKSRLRLFMLDAMYCIQFKAVPLIKQCLEVWMHVLPLAHMGIAKSPLVTCMVYLLHFYKCEDRFNRVQDIRNILNRKYFYEITEWNEPKIIEMFKNAISEIRAIPIEMKMLRVALIVIAKRHGPKWCQNNIVKKLLLPMIESNISERVKTFCISLLGPLLKPYPVDMKVHCEIVMNQLFDILKQNPSHSIEEAVMTSLIYMNKHNQMRVLQTLLTWKPQRVSPELEILLRDYVAEKPLKGWKTVLSKIQLVN